MDQACQVSLDLEKPQVSSSSSIIYRANQGSHSKVDVDTDVINPEVTSDHCVSTDFSRTIQAGVELGFRGIQSILEGKQLVDIAGVTTETFNILLKRTERLIDDDCKLNREDRLLLFLMKLKTGLSFSALGAIFSIDRETVCHIFFQILEYLSCVTEDLIFWPAKNLVQDTMPKSLKDDYGNTRVIIDCTEFRMDAPSRIDHMVWCYSHCEYGFTIKVLICITPGGYICFKSKAAGGMMTDSQITIDSGLFDLLEEGDVVLADKSFAEIKTVLDASGKRVSVVMPPVLCEKQGFTQEEAEETYNVAIVRVHVKRIIQNLRIYKVFDKVHRCLFSHIDDLIHVCCVLVNFQPIDENDGGF
ncbi:hypothetical protein QAD02_006740 [Eretmocerus hayati]|uniref:Uncharacterized protein n=1 Tax=Eretmocerus hayati TaxID=131215 RepID=A0ACC2N1R7_9HYME|nr:hypothetical protein QAD02_006740 [Eretmocerus hayati]